MKDCFGDSYVIGTLIGPGVVGAPSIGPKFPGDCDGVIDIIEVSTNPPSLSTASMNTLLNGGAPAASFEISDLRAISMAS